MVVTDPISRIPRTVDHSYNRGLTLPGIPGRLFKSLGIIIFFFCVETGGSATFALGDYVGYTLKPEDSRTEDLIVFRLMTSQSDATLLRIKSKDLGTKYDFLKLMLVSKRRRRTIS